MIAALSTVIRLDVHIVTGYGTGNFPLNIHGQIFFVKFSTFPYSMAKIHSMTLTTQSIVIECKLFLVNAVREQAPSV
jgi:hypothetical protein